MVAVVDVVVVVVVVVVVAVVVAVVDVVVDFVVVVDADVVVDFAVAFFVVHVVGALAVASFVDLEVVVRSAVDAIQYTADKSVPLIHPHIPLQAHPVEPCPYQARLSLASPSKSAS